MKLLAVTAAVPGYDPGVGAAMQIVLNALDELGESAEVLDVSALQLPYFDGHLSPSLQPFFDAMTAADGVLFGTASTGDAVCALAKVFLEHVDGAGRPLLQGKSCLLLTAGHNGGERAALEYLAAFTNRQGGYDAVRICAPSANALAESEEYRLLIERQAEDYYRILRQNRRYALPREATPPAPAAKPKKSKSKPAAELVVVEAPDNVRVHDGSLLDDLSDTAYAALFGNTADAATQAVKENPDVTPATIPKAKPKPARSESHVSSKPGTAQEPTIWTPPQANRENAVAALYKKHNIKPDADVVDTDEDDVVSEITQFYAQKYQKTETGIRPVSVEPVAEVLSPAKPAPAPKAKNCRQMTESLPHGFNAQAAAGVQAVFQLSITGSEPFEGYFTLQAGDCEYANGVAEQHDILITADAKAWMDVLSGKHTAQRAFMMGLLKVRGNFQLLTKFDQAFAK